MRKSLLRFMDSFNVEKEGNVETNNSFANLTEETYVEAKEYEEDVQEQIQKNTNEGEIDRKEEINYEWADASSSEDSDSEDTSDDQAKNLIQTVVGSSTQKQHIGTTRNNGKKENQPKKDQRLKTGPSIREPPITRGKKMNPKKPSNKSSDD
ncbi:hypothetical protein K7X08_009896 [Anisodus acutangulus]|uniref:Uncharacterized protein n=1 Tax=Anisodus acutangulus TaxID=402998 RepID=A0A9Q1N457_9SOLA|nr:hypothetical protein K7X08_009896 [Anisodus acutangulus]